MDNDYKKFVKEAGRLNRTSIKLSKSDYDNSHVDGFHYRGESIDQYIKAISALEKENKKMSDMINGAECGYGSLKEQGYWSGCEHVEQHYKPIVEKLKKEIAELKEEYNYKISKLIIDNAKQVKELKKTHISIEDVKKDY